MANTNKNRESKNKELKTIPVFKTEDEEREFWDSAETSDYFDIESAVVARFPNLKFSTESISLRLPASMLNAIKSMANKRDVPYQSLIKMILADRVAEETAKYSSSKGKNPKK